MERLYPLKFEPIFKEKLWGGTKMKSILGKDFGNLANCGESWEISGVKGDISVVSEGALKGKDLATIIHEYKDRLLGQKVFKRFGKEFPLLIKFLDANDDLSIQVHPDDNMALERHDCLGKTEMWYIFQADEGAVINTGFKRETNKEEFLDLLNTNRVDEVLNYEKAEVGDVFFLPAGRIHYIGKGICLAEIQQTSDITYRVYDFDRKDDKGNKRELHIDQALDALDYKKYDSYKTSYTPEKNCSVNLVSCPYFHTNLIDCDHSISRDYSDLDSFVIYVCLEGAFTLEYEGNEYAYKKGDSVLIPAEIANVDLQADKAFKVLEVYI